ncbi:hypothetical protein KI387_036014, partial [Taxus chinensis]
MGKFYRQVQLFNKLLNRALRSLVTVGGYIQNVGMACSAVDAAYTEDPYDALLQHMHILMGGNGVKIYFNIATPWDKNLEHYLLGDRFEVESTATGQYRVPRQRNPTDTDPPHLTFLFERGRQDFVPFATIEIRNDNLNWRDSNITVFDHGRRGINFTISTETRDYDDADYFEKIAPAARFSVDNLTRIEIKDDKDIDICCICREMTK